MSAADWPYAGIGIHCNAASPTIERNWIEYNNLSGTYDGGGIWCANGGIPLIRNNVIRGNKGGNGGGIFCIGSNPTVTNNTIVDNVSGNYRYGAGIYLTMMSGTTYIANNIIAYNTKSLGDYSGYGIYKNGTAGTITLARNCSYGNTYDNYYGNLNYGNDYVQNPNLSADHTHLTAASTWCIDKGSVDYAYGAYDVDGDPRVVDGDGVSPAVIDVGADEYVP